jgi:hypothetical protein
MNVLEAIHDTAESPPSRASDSRLDLVEPAAGSAVGRDLGGLRGEPHGDRIDGWCGVDFAKQIAVSDEWCEVVRQEPRPLTLVWEHIDDQRVVEETSRKSFTGRADVLFVQPD